MAWNVMVSTIIAALDVILIAFVLAGGGYALWLRQSRSSGRSSDFDGANHSARRSTARGTEL
jgi:hypothetical protein